MEFVFLFFRRNTSDEKRILFYFYVLFKSGRVRVQDVNIEASTRFHPVYKIFYLYFFIDLHIPEFIFCLLCFR